MKQITVLAKREPEPPGINARVTRVVRTLLMAHGENQGDIASVLGVTQAAVSNKMAGKTNWSLPDIEAMAEHFDVPASVMLEDSRNLIGGGFRRLNDEDPSLDETWEPVA